MSAALSFLSRAVLIDPLVCAGEGFRAALVPRSPHPPVPAVIGALAGSDTLLLLLGLRRFRRRTVGRDAPLVQASPELGIFVP